MRFLVQLFGQDVVDRLSSAGYDNGLAIAQAGPERLSSEASVPLPLARRIVAVAMEEAEGIEEIATPIEPPAPKKPARPARPRRTAKNPAPKSDAAAKGTAGEGGDDSDPFVDEAGLVSWMGFSSRHGAGGASTFSVADGILDPPGTAAGSAEAGTPPVAENPRPAKKPGVAAVTESLWSFGAEPRPREQIIPPATATAATTAAKSEERPAGSPAKPRRRFYDDQ
jgi:hypothetical protein